MKRDTDMTTPAMNALRFIEILQSYGANSARWPATEREAMHAFAAKFDDAQTLLSEQARLDAMLDTAVAPPPSAFLRARILGKAKPVFGAANDRLPYRAIAAMLLVGIFTGIAAGQFMPAQMQTEATDIYVQSEYITDYDWLGETFDLSPSAGGQ